jgi:DNA ligase (NAD+)
MASYDKNHPKIKQLVAKLQAWDEKYHNTGKPAVSDAVYNKWKLILEKYVPDHPYLERVGAPVKGKSLRLPFFMPSLGKVYPERNADKFLAGVSGSLLALDKLDGSAAGVDIYKGQMRMFSRGDGTTGKDISYLLPHVKGIGKLKANEAVRGELTMDIKVFEKKYGSEFENARNTVNGASNNTKTVHKAAKDITFIVHELIKPEMNWKKARVYLKGKGWIPVPTTEFDTPSVNGLIRHLAERKKASNVDLDGLVLIDSKNGNKTSFKVNDAAKAVTIKEVEWNLSKNGLWKPVAILTKGIRLEGVTVTRATLHNAKTVNDFKLGPGAVIDIVRAGGVIPKFVGVIKAAKKPQLPENFKWDKNKVEAVGTKLSSSDKDLIQAKLMTESFAILGIDGIRMSVAEQLVEQNFDLIDLFKASQKKLINTNIGNSNAQKLFAGLARARNTVTHAKLMWASQIWPKGFTDTRFTMILSKYPYEKLIKNLKKVSERTLIQSISNIHGLSPATAKTFIDLLEDYDDFLDNLGWEPDNSVTKATTGSLNQHVVLFTGFRSKQIEADILSKGGSVAKSLSKNVTEVISADPSSTKTMKAKQLKIPVYTVNEFMSKFLK